NELTHENKLPCFKPFTSYLCCDVGKIVTEPYSSLSIPRCRLYHYANTKHLPIR
ncbi:hypothetical protein C0J52_19739, partial [Blattella germanica]